MSTHVMGVMNPADRSAGLDDGRIAIEFGVVRNSRKDVAGFAMGWLPMIWENGRPTSSSPSPGSAGRDEHKPQGAGSTRNRRSRLSL